MTLDIAEQHNFKTVAHQSQTGPPTDCRRVSSAMLPADLWHHIQVVPLALGLQLVSSGSELQLEAGVSEQSAQLPMCPFADVGACFAFSNCFSALEQGSEHDCEEFRLTCTVRQSLVDVLIRAARKIAEDPGAPGCGRWCLRFLCLSLSESLL